MVTTVIESVMSVTVGVEKRPHFHSVSEVILHCDNGIN